MNYIVATVKSWNVKNFEKLKKSDKKNRWFLITEKEGLTAEKIKRINPRYIFFPHWSWIIPEEIWKNYECVVFHMTDLPYGRGGSPLQNLIWRGHRKTKISALKVGKKIDGGEIYIKNDLDLSCSAQEIYECASKIIFDKMIPYLVKRKPTPEKQTGRAIIFERRKPAQSKIPNSLTLEKLYDFIRMLDAEDYPKAFLEIDNWRLEFFQARIENKKLSAKVKIYEK